LPKITTVKYQPTYQKPDKPKIFGTDSIISK